jgi:outer membrane protein, multidrug efflux system
MTKLPKLHALALVMMAASAMTGCGLLPPSAPYERPSLEVPSALAAPSSGADNAKLAEVNWLTWWKSFGDPVLDALLDEASRNNQDLALARGRIAEARATLGLNEANLYPTVDFNASASRKRSSENSTNFNPGNSPVSEDRQLGLSASYEMDFWGKYDRADEAARARLLAQSANRGVVLSTLLANVAQSYFALRTLDAQATLAQSTLATRQENLRLQKRRLDAGVVGELDVRQADSEVASVETTLRQLTQNRRNAESALAVLLGRKPTEIIQPHVARGAELGALYARQTIPANLPSDVLTRRPDVVSAEQTLIAANADIGQARTAYFPKLSLTASVGQQSKDMSTLLDPASMFWNAIGNLTQPIFRAGAIGATVAAANARQQQALALYTQTVQNAFRDVHDALNNVDAGREVVELVAKRTESLRQTLRLAELRYKGGYSSYLEVLSAQRDLFQAESALLDAQRSQLAAIVALYKALGGGWDANTLRTEGEPITR